MSTGTPKTRSATTANPSTPTNRPALSSVTATHASPAYPTTRRHSLYGIEDRVVIDPGSRIWKVGFSGEGRPRNVFWSKSATGNALWGLSRATDLIERAEEDRILEINLERCLRAVFHEYGFELAQFPQNSLLTDPKSRKVILVEHPLLPLYIKEALARILFGNLQVPSISFASSHLLSLISVGRITGLVVDCGYLESTALPIFASRPMFPQIQTTPLAGRRFASHLRSLLLLFGTYTPPPPTLSGPFTFHVLPSAQKDIPQGVLTDLVVEDIKTRCCFVGHSLDEEQVAIPGESDTVLMPPSSGLPFGSSSTPVEGSSNLKKQQSPFQALEALYTRHSNAKPLRIRVDPPAGEKTDTGQGTLFIPGWVRERAAEVLFEGGDVDESSVAEVVLDALLKVPVDLRKTLASSILVVGGTAMLPGFIPRLHSELIRALSPPSGNHETSSRKGNRSRKSSSRSYDRYAALRPLVSHFAILNNPGPNTAGMSSAGLRNVGKAPAFSPACMAWVGGSLAGALKTGGIEVAREKWDEADADQDLDENSDSDSMPMTPGGASSHKRIRVDAGVLPDWTRAPLPMGAPSARLTTTSETQPSPRRSTVSG